MKIVVCPLAEVTATCQAHAPSHLLTLLSPGADDVVAEPAPAHRLWLAMNDIPAPREGLTPPDAALVARLLDFSAPWTGERPFLIHCWAGISRSTAAAFVIACQHRPDLPETLIAQALRAASPVATPNRLVVALADKALGRKRRMIAAVEGIGRGAEAMMGQPFELSLGELG